MTNSPLAGRIALVTGASRGIGRASAVALAEAGAHVIATARTEGALTELDDEVRARTGQPLSLVTAKLENGGNIDRLGAALFERWGRLDVLVHAAAQLGPLSPVGHLDVRDWDKTLTLNLTASWRLIRSFDPLFRRSEAARPIFLTSSVARRPRAFWGAYGVSKAGLEALVTTYAEEVDHTPVRPVLLDPGAMRTRMRAEAMPGEDPITLPDPAELGPLVVDLARPDREPPPFVSFRVWAAEGRGVEPVEPSSAASA
jgi:NAD(P)-dependent dehydrogenase (short-subunit alcohol dehydrogenase family)